MFSPSTLRRRVRANRALFLLEIPAGRAILFRLNVVAIPKVLGVKDIVLQQFPGN